MVILWIAFIYISRATAWSVARVAKPQHPHYSSAKSSTSWNYEMRHFNQTIDHFSSFGQSKTFAQRYMLDQSFWGGAGQRAPIFFFTGAEGGDIVGVSGAYGHIREISERLHGMVVFMESRFFGDSQPFGKNGSYEPRFDNIGRLSVEQILLDYVQIISSVHAEFDPSWNCPTIAFGGSLAGTLAAMMRLKYPTVVDISLASSAPLRGYPLPGVDQYAWRRQVTQNWEELSKNESCPVADLVRRGFHALQNADPDAVQKAFHTCEAPYSGNWEDAQGILWQVLEGEAEFIYPSASSSIPERCKAGASAAAQPASTGLDIAAAFLLSSEKCTNLTAFRLQEQLPDSLGWDYLACTEVVHPIGSNNMSDFFPPYNWTIPSLAQDCSSRWKVEPIAGGLWIPDTFGFVRPDRLAASASRIIFLYGELDPWHVFAIATQPLSEQLPVIMIPGGSHCADMAGSRSDDTLDMIAARRLEVFLLEGWLSEFQSKAPKQDYSSVLF